MPTIQNCLASILAAALLMPQGPALTRAAETDPKAACRAEEVITTLAGQPPDRLDFLGERVGDGSFRCEAYFTYTVYSEVWSRLNALATTLKDVEGICLINGLQKLPKVNGLQIVYTMSSAGQFRITSASDGLPATAKKLSQRLKAGLARLEQVRDADDEAIIREFVRKSCPEADYPPEIEP